MADGIDPPKAGSSLEQIQSISIDESIGTESAEMDSGDEEIERGEVSEEAAEIGESNEPFARSGKTAHSPKASAVYFFNGISGQRTPVKPASELAQMQTPKRKIRPSGEKLSGSGPSTASGTTKKEKLDGRLGPAWYSRLSAKVNTLSRVVVDAKLPRTKMAVEDHVMGQQRLLEELQLDIDRHFQLIDNP